MQQGVNQQTTKSNPTCDLELILSIPIKYTHFTPNPWLGIGANPDKDLNKQGVLMQWKVHIITFSKNQNAKVIKAAIKYEVSYSIQWILLLTKSINS